MYDINGSWKGWDGYVIGWIGWKQIVIPLKGNGSIIENTLTGPTDKAPNWTDDFSLRHIKAIRFDLNKVDPDNPANSDLALHVLGVSAIQLVKFSYDTLDILSALVYGISALVVISILLGAILHKIEYFAGAKSSERIKQTKNIQDRLILFILSALVLKSIVATFTPLSSDFVDIVYGATPTFPWSNVLNNSPTQGGWWFLILSGFYNLWLALPMSHPSILQIFPGNYWNPAVMRSLWGFASTPSSYLLVFMLKLPNIMADLIVGICVYVIISKITASSQLASKMLLVWLFNPFSLLFAEMWGSLDIVVLAIMALSLVALFHEKPLISAFLLGLSIGIRSFPILFAPFIFIYIIKLPSKGNMKYFKRYIVVLVCACLLSILPFLTAKFILACPSESFIRGLPDYSFLLGVLLEIHDFPSRSMTLILLFLFFLFVSSLKEITAGELASLLAGASLLTFALSRWQPHWIIYPVFFLLLDYYANRRQTCRKYLIFLLTSWGAALIATSAYFMSWGNSIFFIPTDASTQVISRALARLHGNIEGFTQSILGFSFQGVVVSIFTAISIFYLIRVILKLKVKVIAE
ncbi:MAG: hypothetical protein QW279_15910 [Candidatus Jordarchaeaceae archaeon]